MNKNESYFKVYSVLCLNNRNSGDYTYLVLTTGGGLDYFTSENLPSLVRKFLDLHNKQENVLLLDWQSYIVFSETVPEKLRIG